MAMEWLYEYSIRAKKYKNFSISVNSERLHDDFRNIHPSHVYYLPNIYNPPIYEATEKIKKDKHILDIGCFGAIRPLKNHLIQARCAIAYAQDHNKYLKFHINATRIEQKGDTVIKNLRALFKYSDNAELVEEPWVPHKEFSTVIRSMDLGMQVSLTETFNIVSADFVAENVPVLVSHEIKWVASMFRVDSTEYGQIMAGLKRTFLLSKLGLHRINKFTLHNYNDNALEAWILFFDHYLDK
jgi:hypothetical protein